MVVRVVGVERVRDVKARKLAFTRAVRLDWGDVSGWDS